MLIDEENPNDGWWVPWQPAHDFLAERHRGKGNVSFADTRTELVTRAFTRTQVNHDPEYQGL
jgi:prepilin-type processing-associated H-X9-DG protein